jgi:anti-anti-sigma regulatory factor
MEDSAELTITTVRGGAEYVRVILQGPIDNHGAQRLRSKLGALLDTGARYLTVDLTDVNCCDEGLLDVLSWAAGLAPSQQGWLALTGVNHHIRFQFAAQ